MNTQKNKKQALERLAEITHNAIVSHIQHRPLPATSKYKPYTEDELLAAEMKKERIYGSIDTLEEYNP